MADQLTFDHYEVLVRDDGSLFELGRGAMGITYKAFDTSLQCPVALKVINAAQLDDTTARQRFVSEARAAARLRHRHVASVFHLGNERDAYFYAMEFIDGETVEAIVKREGPLAADLALKLAIQVARALNAAQQHHLVHRDIKPANLMLVREDEELCIKVIDFGLAKSLRVDNPEEVAATTVAGFVGTPHFASPEQLEEKPIDVRSDIYSLGATLWFALTGEPPFTGSLAQVISAQLHTAPPVNRISHLPEGLRTLLQRMLEKDPAGRPQTPADLRSELEQTLAALPTHEPAGLNSVDALDALETAAASGQARPYAVGQVAAGHYEILEDLGEGAAGDLFRARDKETGLPVRLTVLSTSLLENRASYTALEREVEKLRALEHPNLLRIYNLEVADEQSVLSQEWTDGFSIVELLRARRELDPPEALSILTQAARGADFAATNGLARVDFALHQIQLHFAGQSNEVQERLLRQVVITWPAFSVKISPLAIGRELSLSDTWAGGQTIVGGVARHDTAPEGDLPHRYVHELAAIGYELLGGTPLPASSSTAKAAAPGRYVPLSSLSEEGNAVIRRALDPANSFPSCEAFVSELGSIEQRAPKRASAKSSVAGLNALVEIAREQEERKAKKAPSAPPPATRRKPPMALILFGGAGVLILVALVAILLPLFKSAPPGHHPTIPSTRPAVTPVSPQATPPQTPTRQDLVRNQVTKAEAYEKAGNWRDTLATYLSVARNYPESDIGRVRLEMVLQRLRSGETAIGAKEFRELRSVITEAAGEDVVSAMMILGDQLRREDPKASFNWFCTAAARGNAHAFTQVGLMYSNGKGVPADIDKAIWWFREASERGDAAGTTCLAECYLNGKGVAKDPARARTLLEQAVAAGDARAMNLLGTVYHQGLGTQKNFGEALRLFSAAREAGYLDALGNLGVLNINGDGVPRDASKAVSLFDEGSKKGSAYCMYLLARCLESGTGVAESKPKATEWYRKAAEAGHPAAIGWCRRNNVPFATPGN